MRQQTPVKELDERNEPGSSQSPENVTLPRPPYVMPVRPVTQ